MFEGLAATVTWDTPANAEQHTLRQAVARQRPAWQTKVPRAASLGEAVQGQQPPATRATVAPASPGRRPLTP